MPLPENWAALPTTNLIGLLEESSGNLKVAQENEKTYKAALPFNSPSRGHYKALSQSTTTISPQAVLALQKSLREETQELEQEIERRFTQNAEEVKKLSEENHYLRNQIQAMGELPKEIENFVKIRREQATAIDERRTKAVESNLTICSKIAARYEEWYIRNKDKLTPTEKFTYNLTHSCCGNSARQEQVKKIEATAVALQKGDILNPYSAQEEFQSFMHKIADKLELTQLYDVSSNLAPLNNHNNSRNKEVVQDITKLLIMHGTLEDVEQQILQEKNISKSSLQQLVQKYKTKISEDIKNSLLLDGVEIQNIAKKSIQASAMFHGVRAHI